MRLVVLHRDEDDWWVAEVPSLPGCVSQGGSREEALTNVREAIELYIEALAAEKRPVPPEQFEAIFVAI